MLAQACRSKGFGVAILDADAERLSPDQGAVRVAEIDPKLVCVVVYGQNPNSKTTDMIGAVALAAELKRTHPQYTLCFVRSHTSALPREVPSYPFVDFVLLNEGVYALQNLLCTKLKDGLAKVKGIGHKVAGQLALNEPEIVVPTERMDIDLPGYIWDLLPMKQKPLDTHRSHFRHTGYDHTKRSPFAAIYISLGCRYGCSFCMINIVNRVDNDDNVSSSNSRNMRFWSPESVLNELQKLADMGLETVRISDEMVFLDRRYFEPLIDGLVERGLGLNMRAYARVDTVRDKYLDQFRKAGIGWLGLGIEAGSQVVRQEVSKGSFKDVNIREVVGKVMDSGINVGARYIFGFPDDNRETIAQTLDLALELCTEFANIYPCKALPGSPLYFSAKQNGWKLPDTYEGFAFLLYESQPLATKYLTAAEVMRLRDDARQTYFTHQLYPELVERKFGLQQRQNVEDMTKIKLRRRLLENI